MNAHQRASYWRHHERNLERIRSWQEANREYTRAYAIARYWRNPDHYRALSRDYAARQKMVRAALTSPAAWVAVNTPQMRTCHRLHVTALNLPCGQREECHLNPVCEHAGGAKTRNANWGWRGGDGGSLERVLRKGKAA